ncbi:TraR/DksA C4-type zinc finger protein [candidate division WOR-3 bacterium]|nr:TraR/DksA C4-type zinc finger protein [candidate division WOR-3 bacterium]
METKEREFFENLLFEKRDEILARLQHAEEKIRVSQQEASSELSLYPDHEADIASDAEAIEENAVMIGNQSSLLEEIEHAIRKTDTGEYGICEACGKQIGQKRLEYIPYARFCIRCEEEREMG